MPICIDGITNLWSMRVGCVHWLPCQGSHVFWLSWTFIIFEIQGLVTPATISNPWKQSISIFFLFCFSSELTSSSAWQPQWAQRVGQRRQRCRGGRGWWGWASEGLQSAGRQMPRDTCTAGHQSPYMTRRNAKILGTDEHCANMILKKLGWWCFMLTSS